MDKISVIVPIYNVEKYLDRCIESLINQNYNNLEIILINDGSSDSSKNICLNWKNKSSKIKYIEKTNGGLSSARNAGLDVADGKYILFVDSDDYIEKDAINTLINNIGEYDWLIFNYNEIRLSRMIKKSQFPEGTYNISDFNEKLNYMLNCFFNRKHGWEAWNRLYKRSIIEDNKLRFYDNKIIFAEDIEFNLRYLYYCNDIKIIKDTLYNYIIRGDSIMGKNRYTNKLNEFTNLSKNIFNFYSKYEQKLYLENFYLIHFGIIRTELQRIYHNNPSNIKKFILSIEDYDFFKNNINKLVIHLIKVKKYYGIKNVILVILTKIKKYCI
ncbi:glycosyltransferase [Massilimicrobiota sp. An105]|uniref:glycosyltransferase family 2 protein n=1 Tax=Massilimicrobiota sp. An105 TaxID=1965540 RepID=UPI00130258E0|nr:glycosyltransferase [Massilimicrobiota sp. An105]